MISGERQYGEIVVSEHKYAGGGHGLEYAWEGGPTIAISRGLMQEAEWIQRKGNLLHIGPYRLRIVQEPDGRDPWGRYMCVREGPHAWVLAAYVRLYNLSTDIWRRSIVTLAVWGLADYREATIPCLENIHFVQWLMARRGKAT